MMKAGPAQGQPRSSPSQSTCFISNFFPSAFSLQMMSSLFEEDIQAPILIYGETGVEVLPIPPDHSLGPLIWGTESEAQSFYDYAHSFYFESENTHAEPVTFTLDSGSDIHVIQLHEAIKYFSDKSHSNLKVLGVSGNTTRADLQGHLIIIVEDNKGTLFEIDLGVAHGMNQIPVNLLSVSLLLKSGCIVHLEDGQCYLQLWKGGPQLAIRSNNGMFEIDALPKLLQSSMLSRTPHASGHPSCTVHGTSFVTFGNLTLWHRRIGHLSRSRLLQIHKNNVVDRFKLKGHNPVDLPCNTCSQAKIQRSAVSHERKYSDPATYFGHTVSSDVKSISVETFKGCKYVVNFVDHYTLFGMVYFVNSKADIYKAFELYLRDMKSLGVTVRNIQTDRGSEYFAQEGDIIEDRDRNLHKFGKVCLAQEPIVRHLVQPVELKEKVAENSFRYLFRAVNAMLWEARLSPAFWGDACAYAQYIWNRTPNNRTGDRTTPWTVLTGERARWDKFKVFGCDVWQHIPNNSFYKVPGIPRGRRRIFLGFDVKYGGVLTFDLELRRYERTGNVIFNENFSYRQDALRCHDIRYGIQRVGGQQPLQVNDYHHPNASAVRNLFTDPDAPKPIDEDTPPDDAVIAPSSSTSPSTTLPSSATRGGAAANADVLGMDADAGGVEQSTPLVPPHGVTAAAQIRGLVHDGVTLRPLRLLPIGTKVAIREADKLFLNYALINDLPIVYHQPCPKLGHSASRERYLMYMHASTLRQARELGAFMEDIKWDYSHGFIKFPTHESTLPGHVFMAYDLAREYGYSHVLHDYGFVQSPLHNAKAFSSSSGYKSDFNAIIADLYPKEEVTPELRSRVTANYWAEYEFAKVLNASSLQIDFDLPPEPIPYRDTLPERCGDESVKWKEAMDEEMASMSSFGVYERVPMSVANGRQILGCRWVYKRKTDKNGVVTRYRARLVAQGYRQKEWDSFNPEEISSPVAHKDTLRLFMSTSTALNLMVYSADVKAAFLQSPLKEKIYLRAPPGYESKTSTGEDEILELRQAIYGLKQSSASFWEAISSHLRNIGFVPTIGDPCFMKRVEADGGIVLVCLYVDDVTYAVSRPELAEKFLAELRDRFVIDESEGKPIDYLLGIAIKQDLQKGTVHMNMETAITKLCMAILTKEELVKSNTVTAPMLQAPLTRSQVRGVAKSSFDYLSVVGSLLHISNCLRPDISYAVGNLARFAAAPGLAHVKAAKRVLQYLYQSRSLGITYYRACDQQRNVPLMYEGAKHPLDDGINKTQVFADSDYAADETRRSTMGGIVMQNGGPISWFSTLGKTVALSTCEAEINAAVTAAKDAIHLRRLLHDLNLSSDDKPIQIAEDNSAAISQAAAGIRAVRKAKHYEVRLRFLQELVSSKAIEFVYCPTDIQLADLLTKPLLPDRHTTLTMAILQKA